MCLMYLTKKIQIDKVIMSIIYRLYQHNHKGDFMKKILPAIISLLFATQVFSSTVEWKEDDYKGTQEKLSAPFTAEEVIRFAGTKPKDYDMEFLKSEDGKKLIEDVIAHINKHMVPNPDPWSIAASYDRTSPNAGRNKSLIAHFVESLNKK